MFLSIRQIVIVRKANLIKKLNLKKAHLRKRKKKQDEQKINKLFFSFF